MTDTASVLSTPRLTVSKQAVEGFLSSVTQKAQAMKYRLAQKVDSVPVLKKAAGKIKAFDENMTKKYGKPYKRARNIILGVGMAYAAAKVGAVGLTALCAVNAARTLAPMLSKAEKERQEGTSSGVLDYMARHKAEAALSLGGSAVAATAAVAGISGSEIITGISRAAGAGLAASAELSSIAVTTSEAVRGKASWKDVVGDVVAAGMTAAAYYFGSKERSDSSTPSNAEMSGTPSPDPATVPEAPAPDVRTDPVPDVPAHTPSPDPQPTAIPVDRTDVPLTPSPDPQPTDIPVDRTDVPLTPSPDPQPTDIPVDRTDVPEPAIVPDPAVPAPDPDMDPKNYEGHSDVFVEKTYIQGDRTQSMSVSSDIDGTSGNRFYQETSGLDGGKYVSSSQDGIDSSRYITPDGKEINVTEHAQTAYKNVDRNHDGIISDREAARAEKSLHSILTKEYGKETASTIMEARTHVDSTVQVASEQFKKTAEPDALQAAARILNGNGR
jgi:hypothetical protein